jgi:hypothetical protein
MPAVTVSAAAAPGLPPPKKEEEDEDVVVLDEPEPRATPASAALRISSRRSATVIQGLTLVDFPAQLERCVWDRGCA